MSTVIEPTDVYTATVEDADSEVVNSKHSQSATNEKLKDFAIHLESYWLMTIDLDTIAVRTLKMLVIVPEFPIKIKRQLRTYLILMLIHFCLLLIMLLMIV